MENQHAHLPSGGAGVLRLFGTLSLSGCSSLEVKSAEVSANCTNIFGGDPTCGLSGKVTWGPKDPPGDDDDDKPLLASLATEEYVPDAANFSFDVSGSTFPYPSTGSMNVIFTDTSTGIIQGSHVFPWVRVGNIITFQDPDAVNDWAIDNAGTADKLEVKVVPFSANIGPGLQTIAVAAKNEGVTFASSSKTFMGPCTTYPSPYQCRM